MVCEIPCSFLFSVLRHSNIFPYCKGQGHVSTLFPQTVQYACLPSCQLTINVSIGRECTVAPKEKSCYRCGVSGHISRECPQAGSADGYGGPTGGQECYKCGQVGHIARSCSQGGGYGGGFGGGFGGRQQTCYSCGGFGHMARDCTQGQKCYNCKSGRFYCWSLEHFSRNLSIGGEIGHVSRDCSTEAKGERVCYQCKQPGHVQAACPN